MKGEEEDKSKTLNLGGQIVNLNQYRSHCSDGLVVRKINIIIITTTTTNTSAIGDYKALFGFFFERCYVYNNFTINHRWLVIICSNLNLALRLFF